MLTAPPAMTATTLPAFDANGQLPAGVYSPTQRDFERRFVEVTGSTTRRPIYTGFKEHCSDLFVHGISPDSEWLVDGSYLTAKLDPGDIDFVVAYDPAVLTPENSIIVDALLSGPTTKSTYHCDAYPLAILPASHPAYHSVTVRGREYWEKWFGRDRAGRPKGIVRLQGGVK